MKTILICLSLMNTTAWAGSVLSIPVPQTEITIPPSKPREVLATSYFEIAFSSWQPTHLTEPSELGNTTDFQKKTSPKASFNFGLGAWKTGLGFISTKFGFSYLQLSRTGALPVANSDVGVSQDLNMFQAQVGLEWTPTQEWFYHTTPYLGLAVLPTWSQAAISQFNDGISDFTWAAMASAGLSFNIAPLAKTLGLAETAFELGVETTQGLSNSQLNGTGVVAGTRISWN